jgi:hypothetical protein
VWERSHVAGFVIGQYPKPGSRPAD